MARLEKVFTVYKLFFLAVGAVACSPTDQVDLIEESASQVSALSRRCAVPHQDSGSIVIQEAPTRSRDPHTARVGIATHIIAYDKYDQVSDAQVAAEIAHLNQAFAKTPFYFEQESLKKRQS